MTIRKTEEEKRRRIEREWKEENQISEEDSGLCGDGWTQIRGASAPYKNLYTDWYRSIYYLGSKIRVHYSDFKWEKINEHFQGCNEPISGEASYSLSTTSEWEVGSVVNINDWEWFEIGVSYSKSTTETFGGSGGLGTVPAQDGYRFKLINAVLSARGGTQTRAPNDSRARRRRKAVRKGDISEHAFFNRVYINTTTVIVCKQKCTCKYNDKN